MGWTGEEILALNEKRTAKLEARAREREARHQEPAPTAPDLGAVPLTAADRQRIDEDEKATREPTEGATANPPVTRPRTAMQSLGLFVGIPLAVSIVLAIGMGYVDDYSSTQRAQRAQRVAQAAVIDAEHQKVRDAQQKVADAACRPSLNCWGSKHRIAAIIQCRAPIEKLAPNQYEWTDGWLEPKLRFSQWLNPERGIVRYNGDKIKFQNVFGAWIFQRYECDYDTLQDTALAVRVQPGRLP